MTQEEIDEANTEMFIYETLQNFAHLVDYNKLDSLLSNVLQFVNNPEQEQALSDVLNYLKAARH